MTSSLPAPTPPRMTLTALFLKFLGFGALAFGGPVAQIAMLRKALVDEERWIDSARFNRLLAILQVLPGPEAHELCVHLGMIARGRWGGLLAGLGFMLPGFALMLTVGWLYSGWIANNALFAGALLGIQIVVLPIILRAVLRIGQHVLEDRMLAAIALGSLLLTLAGAPFWIALAAAAAGYGLSHRPMLAGLALALIIGTAGLFHVMAAGSSFVAHVDGATQVTLAALFLAGLKGGLLTFGGAYTAIPYVRADTVGRGWISDANFLDGVAFAGVLPAPLVIFVTFVGYLAGGLNGALVITAGMFLPAFGFSLIFYERLEAIVENPALHRMLAGVAAAVVGIIAATFLQLTHATTQRLDSPMVALLFFGIALALVWRVRGAWVTPLIVASGGLAGWLVLP